MFQCILCAAPSCNTNAFRIQNRWRFKKKYCVIKNGCGIYSAYIFCMAMMIFHLIIFHHDKVSRKYYIFNFRRLKKHLKILYVWKSTIQLQSLTKNNKNMTYSFWQRRAYFVFSSNRMAENHFYFPEKVSILWFAMFYLQFNLILARSRTIGNRFLTSSKWSWRLTKYNMLSE